MYYNKPNKVQIVFWGFFKIKYNFILLFSKSKFVKKKIMLFIIKTFFDISGIIWL